MASHLNSSPLADLLRTHLINHLRTLSPEVHSIEPSLKDKISVVAFVAACPSLHKFMINSGVSGRGKIGTITFIVSHPVERLACLESKHCLQCLQGLCQEPFRRQEYRHQLEPAARENLLFVMAAQQIADGHANNAQGGDGASSGSGPQHLEVARRVDGSAGPARKTAPNCSVTVFVWEVVSYHT